MAFELSSMDLESRVASQKDDIAIDEPKVRTDEVVPPGYLAESAHGRRVDECRGRMSNEDRPEAEEQEGKIRIQGWLQ